MRKKLKDIKGLLPEMRSKSPYAKEPTTMEWWDMIHDITVGNIAEKEIEIDIEIMYKIIRVWHINKEGVHPSKERSRELAQALAKIDVIKVREV